MIKHCLRRCLSFQFTRPPSHACNTDADTVPLRFSYAFDVDPTSQSFKNRRVFAYIDNGIPDGIELDSKGNVYSGTGDGIQVSSLFIVLAFSGIFCVVSLPFARVQFTVNFKRVDNGHLTLLTGLEPIRRTSRKVLPQCDFGESGVCGKRSTCNHG